MFTVRNLLRKFRISSREDGGAGWELGKVLCRIYDNSAGFGPERFLPGPRPTF